MKKTTSFNARTSAFNPTKRSYPKGWYQAFIRKQTHKYFWKLLSMLEKMHQRFSEVDVNCIFIIFFSTSSIPTRNICEAVHNLPTYSGLYIESYFWFCQKSIHKHKDAVIHHCTSVPSTRLAGKHQNQCSFSLLFQCFSTEKKPSFKELFVYYQRDRI